jgi:hypothetical protein
MRPPPRPGVGCGRRAGCGMSETEQSSEQTDVDLARVVLQAIEEGGGGSRDVPGVSCHPGPSAARRRRPPRPATMRWGSGARSGPGRQRRSPSCTSAGPPVGRRETGRRGRWSPRSHRVGQFRLRGDAPLFPAVREGTDEFRGARLSTSLQACEAVALSILVGIGSSGGSRSGDVGSGAHEDGAPVQTAKHSVLMPHRRARPVRSWSGSVTGSCPRAPSG